MKIEGIEVIVTGGREIPQEECAAYAAHVKRGLKPGEYVRTIELRIPQDNPDEVEITCVVHHQPFERIRRITGYLVGGMDRWNDSKRAEERDRVKHGTEGKA